MAAYLVTYDLNANGQNYKCLDKALTELATHWRFQKSAWLVDWTGTAFDLANQLQSCLDSNDILFVTRVTEDSAWCGYDEPGSAWIRALL